MERVKKMVPGTPKSLPDNWNYRNAFVTLFMAAVFSSDCTESDTGPSNCSRYLLLQISECKKRRIRMRMMNKNAATLKPRNQLPVKYAVMLKRPVAFKRVRMKRGQNR